SDTSTGRSGTGYSHDAQCVVYRGPDQSYKGREICIGSNETAISIADVTDKASPKAISHASYPAVAYAHQGWLTDDHRYFYLGDELDETAGEGEAGKGTRTLIWDLQDLDDPVLLKEFVRSEEHTSELQSRENLVCRLLLEKKKTHKKNTTEAKNTNATRPNAHPHNLHEQPSLSAQQPAAAALPHPHSSAASGLLASQPPRL